jgi:DNA-binding CsgD family transcriptional regulator
MISMRSTITEIPQACEIAEPDTLRPTLARPRLSPREVEVLLRWFASDSKQAVAAELYLSVATVNTHLARIRDKYNAVGRPASTKAALVARALQDQLIAVHDL